MAADPRKLEMTATGAEAMMDSANSWSSFYNQIESILKEGKVKNIIVIQSEEDQLIAGGLYQYRFSKDMFPDKEINSKITVNTVKLDLPTTQTGDENAESTTPIGYTGKQAHKDLFFSYAKDHLKLDGNGGVNYVPSQSSETTPVAADVVSLGMVGKQQQSKQAATTIQKRSDVFVIDVQSAQEVFSSISNLKASEIEKGLQQAVALCIQGRYEDAIRAYAAACGNRYEVYPYMYNVIGEALNKLGRTTEANVCFTKARKGQQILDSYSPPSPSSGSSGSSSSSGSSTPDIRGKLDEINRQLADENSQLNQELLANVNE